jgi:hypothetical protein
MRKDGARKLKSTLLECIEEIEYTTERAGQDDRSCPKTQSTICGTMAQMRTATFV